MNEKKCKYIVRDFFRRKRNLDNAKNTTSPPARPHLHALISPRILPALALVFESSEIDDFPVLQKAALFSPRTRPGPEAVMNPEPVSPPRRQLLSPLPALRLPPPESRSRMWFYFFPCGSTRARRSQKREGIIQRHCR